MRFLIAGASALLLALPIAPVSAQRPDSARNGNGELPLEPTRTASFTTTE